MKNLFIVESFSKCKKIKSYLGQNWDVQASSGHISELPVKKLGIDLQSYEPEFVVMSDKKNLLQQLKQKINSNTQVYLAMDPDYEGERIAYELAKNLNIQNPIQKMLFLMQFITHKELIKIMSMHKHVEEFWIDSLVINYPLFFEILLEFKKQVLEDVLA